MTYKSKDTPYLSLIFLAAFFILAQNLSILSFEFRNEEIYNFKTSQAIFQSGNWFNPNQEIDPSTKNPVLFYWLTFLFYTLFGPEWVSGRLASSLLGALAVVVTWLIAKEIFNDRRKAALSAIILITGKLFFRHGRVIVPDMALNLFLVTAFYFIFKLIRDPKNKSHVPLLYLCCGLGFCADGFPAVSMPLLSLIIFCVLTKKTVLLRQTIVNPAVLILAGIVAAWSFYMSGLQGPVYADKLWANPFSVAPALLWQNWLTSLIHFISYGLPWLPFLIPAIPLTIKRVKDNHPDKEPLLLLLIWFFTVFLSFSIFTPFLQERILLLTTPFAILTAYFFLEEFKVGPAGQKAIHFFKRHLILFALTLGSFVFCFVVFILAGMNKLGMPLVVLFYIGAIFAIRKFKDPLIAPLALGIMLITIFSQAPALQKSGLLPHTTIAKMVETVNKDYDDTTLIGAGKNGVPESIVQSFFDRKIRDQFRIADWDREAEFDRVFSHPGKVYYFIMVKDYESIVRNKREDVVVIVQEENIVKKKMRLDAKFFLSIFLWDDKTVRSYLIDKIYLLKKRGG